MAKAKKGKLPPWMDQNKGEELAEKKPAKKAAKKKSKK